MQKRNSNYQGFNEFKNLSPRFYILGIGEFL